MTLKDRTFTHDETIAYQAFWDAHSRLEALVRLRPDLDPYEGLVEFTRSAGTLRKASMRAAIEAMLAVIRAHQPDVA